MGRYGMKKSFQYSIIGVVAFAMFFTGVLISPSFNSESLDSSDKFGVEGYMTLTIFDKNGQIKDQVEKHNSPSSNFKQQLAGCITGLDTTNSFYGNTCSNWVTHLIMQTTTTGITNTPATITQTPEGCSFDGGGNRCTGWISSGSFTHDSLSCTPSVDCPFIVKVFAGVGSAPINTISLQTSHEIQPGDRVDVSIAFTIG